MLDTASSTLEETLIAAKIHGEAIALPDDLYIPPDALQIFLETFEGPLDLLLYLIKKQNMDILNIPIAPITEQYMQYVEIMKGLRFELAAEYLLMAAMLAEIKSRMLLPRRIDEVTEEEEDPRTELVKRLQEYEQFKKAAERLDTLAQEGRDVYTVQVEFPKDAVPRSIAPIPMRELIMAFKDVMARALLNADHKIAAEHISVRGKMSDILTRMQDVEQIDFADLFCLEEGRLGIVVTFLAILELLKQALIEVVQESLFGDIEIKRVTSNEH